MSAKQPQAQSTVDSAPSISNVSASHIESHGSSEHRHFEDHTGRSRRSPMSKRKSHESSDEATPIRLAAGPAGRSYNTTVIDSSAATTDTAPRSTGTSDVPISPSESKPGFLKKFADRYGSVSLENKGSVARDHLALERTFLAWLRTSLAFASIGIAITQLFRLNTSYAKRTYGSEYTERALVPSVPLSPLVGHAIPIELAPYLQQVINQAESASSTSELGPTLLDQLLRPPLEDRLLARGPYVETSFNELHAGSKIRHLGKPLGATFIGISIVTLLVGFHRYFESQYWIIRGKFPASRGSIAFVGLIAGALIVASLVVVVVVGPSQYERKR